MVVAYPRASDTIDQVFWIDDEGPVAGVVLTDWGRAWGCDLIVVDPVTKVGLVEPMRVEDEYQRRGLARSMLGAGLDRLAARGALRLKVGYSTDAARALYVGAGFRPTSTNTTHGWGGHGSRLAEMSEISTGGDFRDGAACCGRYPGAPTWAGSVSSGATSCSLAGGVWTERASLRRMSVTITMARGGGFDG